MGREPRRNATIEPAFNPNAIRVLESRYLARDASGKITETPGELLARVASFVAEAETKGARARWRREFHELMASLRFLPNTPTLINAGRKGGQLAACFVLPIEDSLEGIFNSLGDAARIHQSGGGTGFSFSRLRPKGSRVQSTWGVASGPVSFMKIFDITTETIKQGGARRGANMAILGVDHPDILDFIDAKSDRVSILNFNVSVGATDEFMRAVSSGSEFDLRDPESGKSVRRVSAKKLFEQICQRAWEAGDPGMVFLDRISLFNPTPRLGEMEATNPCGEQPLLPFEACNLGSLNLAMYLLEGDSSWESRFDWKLFAKDVRTATRFLDNVVSLNSYPIPESRKITLKNRKIGLGIMGFADLLLGLGIPYESEQAYSIGERLMSFLDRNAKRASAELAAEKGAFPNWKGSLWDRLGYPRLRNATVSTVAPTGTISILAGASSGVEPIFSSSFFRNILSGERILDVHPALARVLAKAGVDPEQVSDETAARILGKVWSPAQGVSVEAHVRMQAAFQRHSDSAVSKTINLPESATPQDVARAYQAAHAMGCKGITIYRDRSRQAQVLEKANCPTC